jgi:sugar lactone lactonase YvrE
MFALQEDRTAEYEVFRNVIGFCFDERGRIGLLRRGNDKHQSFALVDNEGTLIRETSLAKATKAGSECTVKFTWAGGDRWVVTASELGPDGKTAAWWLDAVSGQLEPVSGFTCPAVKSLIGSGDGGFVALVVHHYKYTMEDELITFDKVGKPRWQIKQDYQNDHALFSPEDITLTSRRQVAVLDNIQHRVQFFDFSGKYASTLHLEKAWGRKPNYPSEICAERNGGILIYDFQGSPPIVRMNGDGKLVSQFRLKHPDGRVIDPTYGVKVSPSGHVWACDGASLVRVTDSGVADLVLGSTPGSIALGGVACLAVDQRGQLYAADERSGAVHIFDQDGKRLRVCTADVADFSKKLSMAHIGIGENGEIFLSSGDSFPETARYIHFGADGKRLGVKQLGLDTIQEKWYPLPTQGRVLVLGYHDAFIVSSEGKVLRKIERRPDGNWLEHPELASVAPNGSFAIVSGGLLRGTRFIVNLYSLEGEPIRTVVLPSSCMDYCFAFTGKYLATCTESEIRLFSPLGEPVFSFQYPLENLKDHLWVCFATQGGRELWMVSAGLKRVCRFELQ